MTVKTKGDNKDMEQKSTLKIERERKFLVETRLLPANFVENQHFQIEQTYLTQASDSIELRLRSQISANQAKYFLTIKKKMAGLDKSERIESDTEITREQFYKLLRENQYENKSRTVKKERFLFEQRIGEDRKFTIEVDVYDYEPLMPLGGKNIIAEIEIRNKDEFVDLELPVWIGTEVTGKKEYSNYQIAEKGFPKRK